MSWNRQIAQWYLPADGTLDATGTPQPFELVEEDDDEVATETIGNEDGWLDVGRFETLTVRVEAGGVGTTVKVEGKVTRDALKETIVSTSVSSGSDADIVRQRDVSDLHYVRIAEDSNSSANTTHAVRVMCT
jgi:hypothetical protein